MNSCHEEGVRDRNRAGIEAADPARDRHIGKTKGKGHLKVWEGWGAAVSDLVLGHGMGSGCIRHWQEVET